MKILRLLYLAMLSSCHSCKIDCRLNQTNQLFMLHHIPLNCKLTDSGFHCILSHSFCSSVYLQKDKGKKFIK